MLMCRIEISGSSRTFLFKAHNVSIADEWRNEIRKNIEVSSTNGFNRR